MADSERQAAAADCVTAARAEHYAAMARRGVTAEERTEFDTRASKAMNNYVKACIIDVAVRAQADDQLHVADIACGRGQDMAKWMYACVAARKRLASLVAMDLVDMGAMQLATKFLHSVCADMRVLTGDMTRRFEGVADASRDVVSCQLALHYLFRAEADLHGFLSECSRTLKHSGVLLVSYVDGRSIVRKCRNVMAGDATTTTLVKPHYSVRIDNALLRPYLPSPYGNEYTFSMRDCIDTVPEYLTHEGVLRAAAKAFGLHAGASMAFHDAVDVFQKTPYMAMVGAKMRYIGVEDANAFDTASLYRFTIFSKSTSALRRWDEVLKTSRETTATRPAPSHAASTRT